MPNYTTTTGKPIEHNRKQFIAGYLDRHSNQPCQSANGAYLDGWYFRASRDEWPWKQERIVSLK